jgi:acetyltransferase-like isoleucine patch superfamily enzyme
MHLQIGQLITPIAKSISHAWPNIVAVGMSVNNIVFGKHSYGKIEITGGTIGRVNVGKYCSIADAKVFMAGDHNVYNVSTFPFGHPGMAITKLMKPPLPDKHRYKIIRKLKVDIGNDVWIGSNAVIFREVNVGDGAVIVAFSTITKDVPPYTIVVGNDKIIRKRFSDGDIEFLLKLKWWDFDDQTVAEIAPILCSSNIGELRKWAKKNGKI